MRPPEAQVPLGLRRRRAVVSRRRRYLPRRRSTATRADIDASQQNATGDQDRRRTSTPVADSSPPAADGDTDGRRKRARSAVSRERAASDNQPRTTLSVKKRGRWNQKPRERGASSLYGGTLDVVAGKKARRKRAAWGR
jgi:hypothetical protein